MIEQYRFSQDEDMQAIGKELFQNGNHIAESTNREGIRVLSFLVIEELVYRIHNSILQPNNATIVVYPIFDEIDDCYNIIITITIYNHSRQNSYDYVLSGKTKKQKQEQNHILQALLDKDVVMEIWFKGAHSKLSNWVAPVINKEIFHEELLKKIIKWNNIDMKQCRICGKKISKYSIDDICSDCQSKETITKNHKK